MVDQECLGCRFATHQEISRSLRATSCSVEDCEENLPRARARNLSNVHHAGRIRVGLAMQDPLDRADYYRQKAKKCHELATHAQFAFIRECYRRHAVRYISWLKRS
jgi:hypothetical protein